MTELLTAAQMRAIEQAAIESGEVTGLELMERAGRGVVDAILEWQPECATAPQHAVVLCGPGNNGGDGFVVARLLKQRGWEVEVFLYGDEEKLPPDAAENCRRWRKLGDIWSTEKFLERENGLPDFTIDAGFGTGLTRPLPDALKRILNETEFVSSDTVAVDAPSGLCLDSGRTLGETLWSDLVITFQRPKVGHFLQDEPKAHIGELRVVDIGIEDWLETYFEECDDESEGAGLVQRDWIEGKVGEFTLKKDHDHKYTHGHAFILSGGPGKGGAARLAARGALRIGAGLVTVGCPDEALTENAGRLDAIMLTPIKGVDGLRAELRDRKVKAVCIGPGFGLGARLRSFIKGALEPHPTQDGGRLRMVLDADALTEFRDDPETLFGMLHWGCVLTPHEGEFGRLFPDILAKLKEPATKGPAYSKVDATREAAKRAGCVVLFKGADTVIAHPDGRCSVNSAHYERSAPWLATAGSGDVLAGFITGLLARGFDPMSAAETAAWLHVECARSFGPGLIAEDISEQLPAVFRELGL